MKTLEESAKAWTGGAMVFITWSDDGPDMVRPAAFVYETPTGLAWVEPSYADPYGSPGGALHMRDGEVKQQGDGFELHTSAGDRLSVSPYDENDPMREGEALAWFASHLESNGKTWDAERERVRALVLGI